MEDIWKKFPKEYAPLIVVACGLLFLIGAIRDWDWVLEGDGRIFNMAWVSNTFGRRVARILVGISGAVIMILGVLYFWLWNKHLSK